MQMQAKSARAISIDLLAYRAKQEAQTKERDALLEGEIQGRILMDAQDFLDECELSTEEE